MFNKGHAPSVVQLTANLVSNRLSLTACLTTCRLDEIIDEEVPVGGHCFVTQ